MADKLRRGSVFGLPLCASYDALNVHVQYSGEGRTPIGASLKADEADRLDHSTSLASANPEQRHIRICHFLGEGGNDVVRNRPGGEVNGNIG